MKTVKTTCDGCQQEIKPSGVPGYYLTLTAEPECAMAMVVKVPPIERRYDFCDMTCLREWLTYRATPEPRD